MDRAATGYLSSMILLLLGLVFIGAAVAVGIDVWRENSANLTVQGFGHTFSQPPWVAVVVGAACGALVLLGLAMVFRGVASRRRLAAERRAAFRDRDRLLRQAEADRAARERAEREREAAAAEAERARVTAQARQGTSSTEPPPSV
jgi:hypothetical protein